MWGHGMNYLKHDFASRRRIFELGAWFTQLPATIQEKLLSEGRERQLNAGQKLFDQGDAPTGLHGIISGEIHIKGTASNGHEVLMAIHRPADWTGFLTCIDSQPHPMSAVAATDLLFLTVPPASVHAIFETDIAAFRHLLTPELRVGRANYRWLIEMVTRPSLQRIASRLLDLARWPYGSRAGPTSPIDNVSQEELANACNLSRQTMNSALRQLEKRGFIRIGYGRIEIVDSRGMQDFIASNPEEIGKL